MSERQKRRSAPAARRRRQARVRRKVFGTPERPRLNVFRSLEHIYAQVIDDTAGHTLASASTLDPELREEVADLEKTEAAKKVGTLVAERAKSVGVDKVVFDRAGYTYHGRVQALADAAREAGLEF
ncbi:MAG: 50S ribosomal protein L18 [Chloroflexota bacterium]|nr:50S ribosomal protein L18 [Chloroflexota bacterium]